ncbi:carbohydrate ABC transporter permease [Microlunatus parietis]|uniref:Multiple sugar transport system permease protein n=1 Tax=Microlunatus parietis TaxID=682979 RepID=A0A7Y9LCP8_9ACTN|nr:sugar ABC transporter permease [Microlunatus parietis]NYE73067.1 multiple sugar transport system permease protein [Microlunatus parietis]
MSVVGELSTLRRRVKGGKEETPDNKVAYLFLAPWLIGLFGITIGPMIASLVLSFTDYNLLQPPNWIGLENFVAMANDARLHNSLRVTFVYVIVSVPLQLALALGIALLLDRGMRGLAFYRSIFYLPSLLGSSVAVAILWRQIFGTTGLVNQVLQLLGVQSPPGWISNPDTALGTIILLHIWTFGSPMIIFLAGLRQIPRMYYEAAEVDGASRWTRFLSITLPLLSPIIFFNLVLQLIGAFQSFTQAFIVSGGSGGPSDSTMFYTLYLYQKGFGQLDMGYASAMAWLLVVIIAGFTAVNFLAAKYWVFYDD